MRQLKKELWPCNIRIDSDNIRDIRPAELWLGEHFGKCRDRWHVLYRARYTEFYFRNQQDAAWFALRWA